MDIESTLDSLEKAILIEKNHKVRAHLIAAKRELKSASVITVNTANENEKERLMKFIEEKVWTDQGIPGNWDNLGFPGHWYAQENPLDKSRMDYFSARVIPPKNA